MELLVQAVLLQLIAVRSQPNLNLQTHCQLAPLVLTMDSNANNPKLLPQDRQSRLIGIGFVYEQGEARPTLIL